MPQQYTYAAMDGVNVLLEGGTLYFTDKQNPNYATIRGTITHCSGPQLLDSNWTGKVVILNTDLKNVITIGSV